MNPSAPDKDCRLVNSFENEARDRCVDIVVRADGRYGFREWRREPEDPGNWSLMCGDGGVAHATEPQAIAAACARVAWFTGRHRE